MHFLGILLILLACLFFAGMNFFAALGAGHATPYMMVLFQSLFSFVIIGPIALLKGKNFLKTKRLPLLFLRALTGVVTLLLIFMALAYLPMTSATLITYSSPLWMPVIAFIFFGQRSGWHVWSSVTIGFFGIFLVLNPHNNGIHFAQLVALIAAFTMAWTYFMVRWLTSTEPLLRIIFYYFLFSTLITLIPAPLLWETPDMIGWISLVGLALSFTLSQSFVILACHQIDPPRISPFIYSVIVFTAIIDHFYFGVILTPAKYFGMLFVLLGGVLTALVERCKNSFNR